MDGILKHYEEGRYVQCIRQLDNFSTNTLMEDFIVQNNLLASKFQNSYVHQEDEILKNNEESRRTVSQDFLKLWSKVLTLPCKKEFNLLILSCACNSIYSLLNCKLATEDISMKAIQIGCEALEQISCNYKLFKYQENNSQGDKFSLLIDQLLQCKKVKFDELSLVLYSCVLVCLEKNNEKYVQLIKNTLRNVESCSIIEKTDIFNCVFLLFPLKMSGGVISCFSNICNFSRICLSFYNCINSSWSEVLALKPTNKSELSDVWEVCKMYADFHSSSLEGSAAISNLENLSTHGEMSYLTFVSCLINAANFALKNQPYIALQFLNLAGEGEFAKTQAGSIVMVCAAAQFKVLRESDFQIEALKIAEEYLLKNPSLDCSIHTDFCRFLLSRLELFRLPDLSTIRFQMARIYLESQRYREAVVEYEKLSVREFHLRDAYFSKIFKFSYPSSAVVLHEHILALVLAKDCEKALNIIESSLEEDFVLYFLHAEIRIILNQYKRAIPLINRAITKLNTLTFPFNGTQDVIKSKLHFKLAQLFDQIGNTKDAFHQLKLSAQHGAIDIKMKDFYEQFTRKLGSEKECSSFSDTQETLQEATVLNILENVDDLAIRYAILNHKI